MFLLISSVTVADKSKAYTVFARSEAEIVDFNLTQGMDIAMCMCLFCVFVFLCLGRSLTSS
jgi:hypothetical protein